MSLSQSISSEEKEERVDVELHVFLLKSVSDTCTETGEAGEEDLELEMPSSDERESGIENRAISASGSHKTANVRPEAAETILDHRRSPSLSTDGDLRLGVRLIQ